MKSFAAIAAMFLFQVGNVWATDNPLVREYLQTSVRFIGEANDASVANNPGRIARPDAQAMLALLTDERRFLGWDPVGEEGVGDMFRICTASNNVMASLMTFNQRSIAATTDQVKLKNEWDQLAHLNLHIFARPLTKLLPFIRRCTAKLVRPTEADIIALPREEIDASRMRGLNGIRQGHTKMIRQAIDMATMPDVDVELRIAFLQAAVDTLPDLMHDLPLANRAQLRRDIDTAQKTVTPGFGSYLDHMRKILEDESCGTLCQL